MEFIFDEFYLDNQKWNDFHPQHSILHNSNLKFIEEIVKITNNKISDIITPNKNQYKFVIFSIWDFPKPDLPKFQILSQTDDNLEMINNITCFFRKKESLIKWMGKSSTYKDYIEFIEKLNKERIDSGKKQVHFWDFLHSYKTFMYPMQFVTNEKFANNKLVALDIKNRKIVPPEKCNNDLTWIWDAYKGAESIPNAEILFWTLSKNYYYKFKNRNSNFFIYEFPISINIERFENINWFRSCATISIGAKSELSDETISKWSEMIFGDLQNIITSIVAKQYNRYAIRKSIQSSIAAIMSRNGSHNIGSHVLASVGNNSTDLSDDQTLFKYIQHRMDYIAQITTEMPGWTYSSLFVQNIIRRFYMQRHLLNNIAKSEGLEAYEYQKRKPNGEFAQNKWNDEEIEGKLIITVKKQGSKKYLIAPYDNKIEQNLDALSLAIPGGIIGQHAFFTILENIIRNSAKHEWSKRDRDKNGPKNLEITIEYEDKLENDFVVFRISDNVSDVFMGRDIENGQKKALASKSLPGKPLEECKDSDKLDGLPLHQRLNCYLIKSFVDQNTGKLLKANWGLAEMKISTGYLNRRNLEEIGEDGPNVLFKQCKSTYSGLIRAIGIKETKVSKNNGDVYRLGFEFAAPKPKEVLFIGGELPKKNTLTGARMKSVYFEKTDPESLDYEFVIFQKDQCKRLQTNFDYWHYPHRLFCVYDGDKPCNLKGKIVPVKESDLDNFKKDGEWNGNWDGLKLFLYKSFLDSRYLGSPNDTAHLYVNTDPAEGSGGDSGKTALGIFLDYYKDEIYGQYVQVAPNANNKTKYDTIIYDIKSGKKSVDHIEGFFDTIKGEIDLHFENNKEPEIYAQYDKCLKLIRNLMIKYDENIETIPHLFKAKTKEEYTNEPKHNAWEISTNNGLFDSNSKMELVLEKNNPNILYKRHGEPQINSTALYQEALSGAQFYFSMLENPPEGYYKKKIALQLVENALAKILIIDERAANYYLDSASEIKERIKEKNAGIHIVLGFTYKTKKYMVVERDINSSGQLILDDPNLFYNYIIIHQGILDKITPDRDSSEDEDTYRDNLISFLKEHCDLLVVTSGRGHPDTLKKDLKFLPFSNLESFLMKPYHEKFLLVQALNQLIRKEEG